MYSCVVDHQQVSSAISIQALINCGVVEVLRVEKSEPFKSFERPKYIPNYLVGHQNLISISHPDNRKSTLWVSSPKQNSFAGANEKPLFVGKQLKKRGGIPNYPFSFPHAPCDSSHALPSCQNRKIHQETIISIIDIHMHNLIQFTFLYAQLNIPSNCIFACITCIISYMVLPSKVEHHTKKHNIT